MQNDYNLEKYIDEQMGFEDDIDNNDEDDIKEKPFNADAIRIDQQILSLKYIYDLYKDGDLRVDPDFQRGDVWESVKKQSLLIESLMLRIPIPAFYFYEKNDGKYFVIDGRQRLTTIFKFINDEFALSQLEYLSETHDGLYFSDLSTKYKQRILRTQFAINVLDERSPEEVIYDIFRRINTGGERLTPQEMRNAICSDKARELLRKGASLDSFKAATRNKIKDKRQDDKEMFLRFITLYERYDFKKGVLNPLSPSKLIRLMDVQIKEIEKFDQCKMQEIINAYDISMQRSFALFGKFAFGKIKDVDGIIAFQNKDIINKSLFVSFAVLLADPAISDNNVEDNNSKVLKTLAKKLTDLDFENAISKATGDERNIRICFGKSLEVLKECQVV